METRTIELGGSTLTLVGICQGLEGEAEAAVETVQARAPPVVALALGPEVAEHAGELPHTPVLGAEDEAYRDGLSEWGTVTLPAPAFPAVVAAAEEVGARVEGVDMARADYLDRHLDLIGIRELLLRALKVRWLGWRPPSADSPGAFCRAFDARLNEGPFGRLEEDRERSMAENLAAIEEAAVVCVLEIERLDGVTRALRARDHRDR